MGLKNTREFFMASDEQPISDSPSPLDMLVIGAHPDDAELFAGGTIALLAERG